MQPDPKDAREAPTLATSSADADTVLSEGSERPPEPVHLALGLDSRADDRYQLVRELGRGGMGEVHLCLDRRIGREVARKRCTAPVQAQGTAGGGVGITDRFLREICVQGQLEHPTIVPLHDLSVGKDGEVYFTMKHVRGRTLKSILASLRSGDAAEKARSPLRKLLGAFASVCLGVAFAHSRGVIHRDLKPENLMLGEFGEVYVLDWGVAKVVGVPESRRASLSPGGDAAPFATPNAGETTPGSIIGTPGYMSPEQCVARPEVDERADVYALGAILFEIVAGVPLHEGDGVRRIQSTLAGADARISVRAPSLEPVPELEAACVKATARRPQDRFAGARELHDVVERFLNHDRDLELRRELASKHAAAAAAAVDLALSPTSSQDQGRRTGMAEAGRALALDPGNEDAMRVMLRLLTTPPRGTPPEVDAELDTRLREFRREQGGFTALGILGLMLVFPLYAWMGVRSWLWFWMFAAVAAAFGGFQLLVSRGKVTGDGGQLVSMTLGALAMCGFTATCGPVLLVPGFAALLTLGHALHVDRHRLVIFALGCIPILVPVVLQALGLLPPSYAFDERGMTILPVVIELRQSTTMPVLFISALLLVGVAAMGGAQARNSIREAERRLSVHAWQLRQLVPAARAKD
jgi:serine/threonine protein kinase